MAAPSSPGPQTLPCCHQPKEPGTQRQAPQATETGVCGGGWAGPTDCDPGRQQGCRDRDGKRFTTAPRPGLHQWVGALQDTAPSLFPGSLSSPTGPRLGNRPEGPREKARIWVLPHCPPDDHYSTDLWLNPQLRWSFINSCSLRGGTYCRPNQ